MDHEISCDWKGGMAFESDIQGHKVMMDAVPEFGGKDSGPSPKRLVLAGLAGCTGIDIASLIKKMHLEVDDFDIQVGGDLTEEHPRFYSRIHVNYTFYGAKLDPPKIEKAVALSWDRYCGVAEQLRCAASMSFEINYQEAK
ncbi:OsmC family protein [Pontibacter sp. G13]|uniref:OsmC family protein n=1 Tax=Pontibacter sp. G13 TaxID=3074898 RepID=UPI002889BD4A|nr:OsmC family protein [Pontibacter sp. G13]WNJ18757.1 OsmC family protein [Pontibacter sp. G13]